MEQYKSGMLKAVPELFVFLKNLETELDLEDTAFADFSLAKWTATIERYNRLLYPIRAFLLSLTPRVRSGDNDLQEVLDTCLEAVDVVLFIDPVFRHYEELDPVFHSSMLRSGMHLIAMRVLHVHVIMAKNMRTLLSLADVKQEEEEKGTQ